LIRDATVIAMDAAHRAEPFRADVLVDDGRIGAIGPEIEAPPGVDVLDGRDRLVMPGLVNAHLHSMELPFRGRYDGLPLELWMLLSFPILGLFPLPDRLLYLRTLVVAIESLKNGVTCVLDDISNQDLDGLRTVFDAYDAVGMRATVSGHVMNRLLTASMPFAADVLPAALLDEEAAVPPPTTDAYLEFSREAIRRHHNSTDRLRYAIAPSGPQRCSDELLVSAMELAQQHDTTYHIHVLETKVQAVTGRELYSRTMVEHLDHLGVVQPRTTMAHGIWLTDDDIACIAARGASVAHNPISNQKLGAGIAPFRTLVDTGVNLGLGTDGISSNDSARMFDVMKAAALLHHVATPDYTAWPTAAEVLRAATIGGARSANLHEVAGSLEIGKAADLVVLDLRTVSFTPRNDLGNLLVYSENGASIEYVLVGGEVLVDHGRVTRIDEAAVLEEFRGYMPEFHAQWEQVEELNRRFLPYFHEIHDRCSREAIGFNRYSGDPGQWEIAAEPTASLVDSGLA
ncbi:MAG: amidohydrolase, partial [Actinobacteria bacterium]|nr:amidohydrolase [Actinomycetota bacterium]